MPTWALRYFTETKISAFCGDLIEPLQNDFVNINTEDPDWNLAPDIELSVLQASINDVVLSILLCTVTT